MSVNFCIGIVGSFDPIHRSKVAMYVNQIIDAHISKNNNKIKINCFCESGVYENATIVKNICVMNDLEFEYYNLDVESYGKTAILARNIQIVKDSDIIYLLKTSGSIYTQDIVRKAKDANKECRTINL
jgi:uncharacterized membrane protein